MKAIAISSPRRLLVNMLVLCLMLGALAATPSAQGDENGLAIELGCTRDIDKPHSTGLDDGIGCYSIGNFYYACQCQSCCQTYYVRG
jgi:hypothetical protein